MWERWKASSWAWASVFGAILLSIRPTDHRVEATAARPVALAATPASEPRGSKMLGALPADEPAKWAIVRRIDPGKVVLAASKVVVPPSFAPVRSTLDPRVRAAYESAAVATARRSPTCSLRWTILAAVGAIESANGAHHRDAVVLTVSGALPRVIGPVLDGTKGTAAIADTDAGSFDDDTTWDRVVGPMQFLPSTWKRSGRDGNNDGVADPHSIDDAALAAADYLCANSRDLSKDADLEAAFFSYNRSMAYVATVRLQLALFDAEFNFATPSILLQATTTSTSTTSTTSTTVMPSTTVAPSTTVMPSTTIRLPTTTSARPTTTVPATTVPATTVPATTVPPTTTTSVPATTVPPATVPPPSSTVVPEVS